MMNYYNVLLSSTMMDCLNKYDFTEECIHEIFESLRMSDAYMRH